MSGHVDTRTLVDERTGIVTRLTPTPTPDALPATFGLVASVLSDTTRFSAWPSDSSGAGYAFADEAAATAAAVGEAVERYCGNLVPPGLVRIGHRELTAAGRDALDPASVALFSPAQYARPGFPFVPMTADLTLEWAPGVDLATGSLVLVPASLVWVSYPAAAARRGMPVTNPIIQAGLAAGPDTVAARLGALHEVLERDAMALTWHGRRPLRLVEPPPALAALGRGRHGSLHTRFLAFDVEDTGTVVAGALVRDPATGYLTMGTAARARAEPALRKALAEALQLQLFVAGYDDPDGPYMRAARDPRSPLKPWRADRSYGDAYRADLADLIDYGCHLQLHLDPWMQDRFEAELAAATTGTVHWTELDRPGGGDTGTELDRLVGRLAAGGERVIAVDVTTADVRPTGLRACRVLVPGRYSNSAAGLPFLGGTRLAASLGGDLAARRRLPLPH